MPRAFLVLLALAFGASAFAQSYPNRPVRVIVPFGAGSTTDIVGRTVAEKLTLAFGQNFICDNRAGATGTIGTEMIAKAQPDGYTIGVSTAALPITGVLYRNLRYDTAKDLTSLIVVMKSPLGLAANVNLPVKSVKELIAHAKANPGKIRFGSLGIGTSHHLTGEKLKLDAGIDMVHIPFKGSPEAHTQLIGGHIDIMFDNIVALMPQFKAGRLRPLAVSSAKRHPGLPDVPSLQEDGVKDFETVAWFGIIGPAGMPREIVARLNAEMNKALQLPDVRQRFQDSGAEIFGGSPEAAAKHLAAEMARWGAVAKAANIRLD